MTGVSGIALFVYGSLMASEVGRKQKLERHVTSPSLLLTVSFFFLLLLPFFPFKNLCCKVLECLLKRVPVRKRGVLRGYRRCSVNGMTYPGIVRDESDVVNGVVILGLTPQDVDILDDFEGEEYDKVKGVSVLVENEEEPVKADAYVYCKASNLVGSWDYESFRKEHLEEFLAMCFEYVKEEVEDKNGIGSIIDPM